MGRINFYYPNRLNTLVCTLGLITNNESCMSFSFDHIFSKKISKVSLQLADKSSSLITISKERYNFNDNEDSNIDAVYTQVISDVDDTLKSSGGVNVGGVYLGGVDKQYERGDFYPGVSQFYLELSLVRHNNVDDSNIASGVQQLLNNNNEFILTKTPPKVAILTARAEEFKVALELKDTSKLSMSFRNAGLNAGIDDWGIGPVLYGSVAEWIIQDRKGLRKFTNFEKLLQQDPTGNILQYVYVGDTGELDQEAGETMLREYPEVVKAVFLHVVSDEPDWSPIIPPPKIINGRPLIYFRTYVGAAHAAKQLGFINDEALKRVIDAAVSDLVKMKNVPPTSDKWIDLNKDIDEALLDS